MNDEMEGAAGSPASEPAARPPTKQDGARRARLRPYVHAWLLSTMVFASLGVMWAIGQNPALQNPAEPNGSPLGAFVVAPLIALLSLPALWLLRLFPERSPSTGLRFVRRFLLGAICGSFAGAILVCDSRARRAGRRPDLCGGQFPHDRRGTREEDHPALEGTSRFRTARKSRTSVSISGGS